MSLALPPAWAGSKLAPPDLSRYLRWGPLRVRPGIEISNLGYDTNIFFNDQAKVGDYTATLAPRMEGLILLGSSAFVTFDERLEYTLYLDNGDQNFLNQRGRARLTVPFQRIGFFTDLSLNRIKERPADRLDIRPERRENLAGFGMILEPGWRTTIELGLGANDYRHSDRDPSEAGFSVSDLLDRVERGVRFEIGYNLLGRTDVTLEARRKRIDFDNDLVIAGRTVVPDSREWSVMPGLRFKEGGPLTGSLRLGWADIDAQDDARPDLSEAVGEVELSYVPSSRMVVQLDGRRLPGFAVFEDSTYYLDTSLGLRVIRYVNRAFGVEAGGKLGRLTFPQSSGREDQVQSYDAGVRLRLAENALGRRVEYSLKIGRYERDSNLAIFDQSQGTVSLGAVMGF